MIQVPETLPENGIYFALPLLNIVGFNFRIWFRLSVNVNDICKQI